MILTKTGNNNNGTISPTGVTSVSGIPEFGKAFSFNGSSGYINMPNPLSSTVCDATVIAWSYDAGMDPALPAGGVVAGWGNGWMNTEYRDNYLRFELRNASVGNAYGIAGDYKNKWLFTALVLDNGKPYGYINGDLVWSTSPNIGCIGLPTWRIGLWDRYFNGTIDEVRIYSQALSLSEIQKYYAEGLEKRQLTKK